MELALTIFNIGVGIGILMVAAALVYLAWQLTPLIRDSRALAADIRRLTRAAETELHPVIAHAREVTDSVEELGEDAAVGLERLSAVLRSLHEGTATLAVPAHAYRPTAGSVESSETGEETTQP